ncbi:ATP-NAD kinase-like domain-containing protein [Thamnocephalis sphaerospora]|uniref:ATP-NAD kinase-like domain-containing protein n=1 Tax=Thamnocephalis sphaerospora TaxID=78915 RepID=A0A4P9XMD9_9FUNG|nr:ATP-NAD kinase-like domain-containing protein [Thamnocephalis sphaerospora]|eukprot:RKP06420.1 ATP-NAD kinase-like domain-containing protein [Thamnocephalis sphaerospora]
MRVQYLYRAVSNVKVQLGTVRHVVIVTKPDDPFLVPLTREVTIWLLETYAALTVHVNSTMQSDTRFKADEMRVRYGARTKYWNEDIAKHVHIDLVVTLGGDGTVLYAANLFQRHVPVIVPFHLGSLGFLTIFNFENYRRYLSAIIDNGGMLVNLRMRIDCSVYKRRSEVKDAGTAGTAGEKILEKQVLNELVVDRGANAGMVQLDLFADDVPFTTILADGLVIGMCPARALSANGSLVHPEKNSVLVTPICPHTLTCRPMIIPGTKRLRVVVAHQSRTTAWASFDGRNRIQLNHGDSIVVTAGRYPVITVSRENQSTDWFSSLREVLNWNERKMQKPLLTPCSVSEFSDHGRD